LSDRTPALSVSDALRLAKRALEQLSLKVVGEVSECTVKPGYKAVYFTIRDEGAVLPCLMWRDAFDMCGMELRPGMLVEASGSFTAYAAKGRMQFQVRTLDPAGEGVLRLQVAALARRLEAEGLMASGRKRPLPTFPGKIGVVTSPRGKAVHDVIRTLSRRYPVAELVIAGVQVEGEGAVSAIVDGIRAVSAHPGVDVVILGRGGGSYEDLMPFNAEEIARAIVACAVPVVTGIGHEPDDSIADMVADYRASTPTAAAEAVAPAQEEVAERLDASARLLGRALTHAVRERAHHVRLLAQRPLFRDVACLLSGRMQALDLAAEALHRSLPESLRRSRESLARAREALGRSGARALERGERDWDLYAARLEDLSPLGILKRGYAVCYDATGSRVVRAVEDAEPGERVRVRLASGSLGCLVEETRTET
jgi:exodeoxyribonuclease VII large subunit